MPRSSPIWYTAKPPMAAKAPWHSEICPARPVMTVIDRNTMARITAWVTRNSHTVLPSLSTTARTATTMTAAIAVSTSRPRPLGAATACDTGGGSTPDSGSDASRRRRRAGSKTSTPNSTRNGIAGVTFSWIGPSHSSVSLHRGRNVEKMAMSTPSPSPPASARGRLVSWPTAAAAIATTTMLKNSPDEKELKRGAIRTPARPAKNDDSAQAKADTRSAEMPLSSVIRGLSTTARMRSPTADHLNSAPSESMARTAAVMATSSSRLKA